MIKDRGIIKFTSMMLPEHVQRLKDTLINEDRIKKPILDEQKIEEIEMLILEGMEFNYFLSFHLYNNGFIKIITGNIHFIDHLNKKIRVMDENQQLHFISFNDLINVKKT